jgi:hypothetical protein
MKMIEHLEIRDSVIIFINSSTLLLFILSTSNPVGHPCNLLLNQIKNLPYPLYEGNMITVIVSDQRSSW